MKPQFKLIIFDFDGTLVDTSQAICTCMQKSFKDYGHPEPDETLIKSTIGLSLEASMRKFCEILGCTFNDGMPDRYRQIYDNEGLGLQMTAAYPEAHNMLRTLAKNGINVAVISNKAEQAVADALQRLELDSFVDCAVGEHPEFKHKPSTDPFFRVLRSLNITDIKKQDIMVVGDTITDVTFAQSIGVPICWARYGYAHENLEEQNKLDYIIDSLEELIDIVIDPLIKKA